MQSYNTPSATTEAQESRDSAVSEHDQDPQCFKDFCNESVFDDPDLSAITHHSTPNGPTISYHIGDQGHDPSQRKTATDTASTANTSTQQIPNTSPTALKVSRPMTSPDLASAPLQHTTNEPRRRISKIAPLDQSISTIPPYNETLTPATNESSRHTTNPSELDLRLWNFHTASQPADAVESLPQRPSDIPSPQVEDTVEPEAAAANTRALLPHQQPSNYHFPQVEDLAEPERLAASTGGPSPYQPSNIPSPAEDAIELGDAAASTREPLPHQPPSLIVDIRKCGGAEANTGEPLPHQSSLDAPPSAGDLAVSNSAAPENVASDANSGMPSSSQ